MTGNEAPDRSVVVVGSTMIDQVAYVPRMPALGETVTGHRYHVGFGGKGANQAVMASLLGAEVAMVCAVGTDPEGERTLANFTGYGIDTSGVSVLPGTSGVAPIWVDESGANQIVIVPGVNLDLTPEHAIEAVRSLPSPRVAVGQFEIRQRTTAAGLAEARRRGAVTVLNPAPAASHADEIDADLLAATDWLVPNETELATLTGMPTGSPEEAVAAADVLAAATRTAVIVTVGAAGALVVSGGSVEHVPAPAVDAVDTTGAGDAFIGGFAYGLAIDIAPVDAVRLGCALASDSVLRPGTQSSFPDRERCRRIVADLGLRPRPIPDPPTKSRLDTDPG